eukprot:s2629_g2.t1
MNCFFRPKACIPELSRSWRWNTRSTLAWLTFSWEATWPVGSFGLCACLQQLASLRVASSFPILFSLIFSRGATTYKDFPFSSCSSPQALSCK